MFDDYKVYGPYGSKRQIVVLVAPAHRTTMSYARYLLCLELGRMLSSDEEADHVDDNPFNDMVSNLQVLPPAANRAKSRRPVSTVTLTCPECGIVFTRDRRNTSLRSNGTGLPSCCSRNCSAKYHNKRRPRKARGIRA